MTKSRPGAWASGHTSSVSRHVIGAKAKVAKAMRAFKKKTENDPVPLCHPGSPTTSIKFYDARGELIATGNHMCKMGTIQRVDGEPVRVMVSYQLDDVANEPLVPADALWGIDEVGIQKLQRVGTAPTGNVTIKNADDVKTILDAMNVDQAIEVNEPNAPQPSCLPTHSVSFRRKGSVPAYTTYTCHLDEIPTTLSARFTISGATQDAAPLVDGRIEINPRKIENVYAAARDAQH